MCELKHQIHFGKRFYLDKSTGYWISTQRKKIRAHVFVWEYFNGKIPTGFHIHHIDKNKSNNDISNLSIISASDHSKLHMTEERRKWASENAKKYQHRTKIWHASDEGREWHRINGKKCWEKRKEIVICCLQCGKEKTTKSYNAKFCHNNCKAKYGREIRKNKKN